MELGYCSWGPARLAGNNRGDWDNIDLRVVLFLIGPSVFPWSFRMRGEVSVNLNFSTNFPCPTQSAPGNGLGTDLDDVKI